MPNWCQNNVKFVGDKLEIKRLKRMCTNRAGGFTFDKLVPEPLALKDTTSPVEKPNHELIEAYGADNWYDWRLKNWGVKWDATETEWMKTSDDFSVAFQTPWGPPEEFYRRLSIEFPSVRIEIQYADEFLGQLPAGEMAFEGGELVMDEEENEGTKDTELFAEAVWMKMWVTDREELKYLHEEEE